MSTEFTTGPPVASEPGNIGLVVGVVVAAFVVIMGVAIVIWFYCRRRRLNEKAVSQHARYRQTIKDHPSSVFTVEKNALPIEETCLYSNVSSHRAAQYATMSSSLPTSGRSVSYDCLGDGQSSSQWLSLRGSVASDSGFYGSESLSTSQLNGSVSSPQGLLRGPASAPERSLSSDHVGNGRWPGVSRRPCSKASSLGRDSGLGGSQETCLSYQLDLKASLSSMSFSEQDFETYSSSERPKSLPPFHGSGPLTEIKQAPNVPIRSMYPNVNACLDENDNEPGVHKQIKRLRDMFYTMRNQGGARDDTVPQKTMGTPNFVIGIFGTEGGHLQLIDGSATLAIPKDALPFEQEVYLFAYYENACIDGKSYLRRVIECGPDGLAFKKPVCLSFIPRLIPCDESESEIDVKLNVVYKNAEPENWRSLKKKESFFHAEHDFVSIHVDHFTRFTVEPASAGGASSGHVTSQPSQDPESRKFYVSVFIGPAAAGATNYRVCFIERDKDKFRHHINSMASDGFHQAVASPKPFSVLSHGSDVRIEIPSLHGCQFRSLNTKHVVPLDEFDDQTVEDIGPPQRDFLLGLTKHTSEGLFEVAVFQESVHDKVLTFCISINNNSLKDKLSPHLTHREVMEFLAGSRLAKYEPNMCFPKSMKLDICTVVERSQSHGWQRLAEVARIPGNKSSWLESYVREKQETPCYVILDFIEAQLISKDISIGEACDQLIMMLERSGFEVAADYCKSWKANLLQPKHRILHKDKGGGARREDNYFNLSPSREELGTILEESNTAKESPDSRANPPRDHGRTSRHPPNIRLPLRHEPTPNGGSEFSNAGRNRMDRQFSSDVSPTLLLDSSDDRGSVTSLPSPNPNAYTISRPVEHTPPNVGRPNKRLVKANREKSGRNDSGIGSEIASPVESEGERTSHI